MCVTGWKERRVIMYEEEDDGRDKSVCRVWSEEKGSVIALGTG